MILFQNIGSPEIWANSGGVNGLVLMVISLIVLAMFGLVVWVVKRTIQSNEKASESLAKSIDRFSEKVSENMGDTVKLLAEFNIRQSNISDDIEEVKKKQEILQEGVERTMGEVSEVLKSVIAHLQIHSETIKNLNKRI